MGNNAFGCGMDYYLQRMNSYVARLQSEDTPRIKFEDYQVKSYFYLDNGIYTLETDSGTGKTFLAKTLMKYNACGEPVNACILSRDTTEEEVSKLIKSDHKVFMLDGYERSPLSFASVLLPMKDTCIILIDAKYGCGFNTGWARLALPGKGEIYVGK